MMAEAAMLGDQIATDDADAQTAAVANPSGAKLGQEVR